jgi:hypothetical protein
MEDWRKITESQQDPTMPSGCSAPKINFDRIMLRNVLSPRRSAIVYAVAEVEAG